MLVQEIATDILMYFKMEYICIEELLCIHLRKNSQNLGSWESNTYKNYLIRLSDFLNDDLNAPSSPIFQAQTSSFSPSLGMVHVMSRVLLILAQCVVEDTMANPRRRTENGRNIFQVLKMVLCRIFPTERTPRDTGWKWTPGKESD